MHVVAISLGTARQSQIQDDLERAIASGWVVDLIVTKVDPWQPPGGVVVHAIGTQEARHPVLRLERFLVLRLPRLTYALGRQILAVLTAIAPGPTARPFRRAQGGWKRRWIVTRQRTARFHKERWGKAYANVRPFVLWRTARRHVLADLGRPDVIVCGDGLSSPLAWHLARRHPDAAIGFSLAEAEAELARRRAAPQPA